MRTRQSDGSRRLDANRNEHKVRQYPLYRRGEHAFSLAELLVVVVVIISLAAAAATLLLNQREKADMGRLASDATAAGRIMMSALSTGTAVTYSSNTLSTEESSALGHQSVVFAGIVAADFPSGSAPSVGDCLSVTLGDSAMSYCLPDENGVGGGLREGDATIPPPPPVPSEIDYLIIGGGGGGGSWHGGGGGAGGYLEGTTTITAGTYPVIVGQGGAGAPAVGSPTPLSAPRGTSGGNSSFNSITAVGGGGGGSGSSGNYSGLAGGSGGGASWNAAGGTGLAGQGTNGGNRTPSSTGGAGGGGAGGAGATIAPWFGGAGGAGQTSSITGTAVTRAGGGGGGAGIDSSGGAATGGGGAGGGFHSGTGGLAGADNTGGGGGGGSGNSGNSQRHAGGNGGSGVVILRYPDSLAAASITDGELIYLNTGGYHIYIFNSSGSITWS